MISSLDHILELIDESKKKLDLSQPLPDTFFSTLYDTLALDLTYNSNAIEGNTLSLSETKIVLNGSTVGGKTIREHLEVTNHRDAIFYVEDIINDHDPFGEWTIINIHAKVLRGIEPHDAGRYRSKNVVISGAGTTPPDFLHLDEKMKELHSWYITNHGMHPIRLASEFHTRFVEIHPFADGNGRTGRLLMNLVLMKLGYPITIIRKEDRIAYYDALDDACVNRNYNGITMLVARAVQRSLNSYLSLI